MKYQKSLSILFVAIGLVVSLQSCATKHEAQVTSKENSIVVKSPETPDKSKSITTANSTSETSQNSLANFDVKKSDRLTDSAKFLAGMKVNDTQAIAQLTKSGSWKQHAASFDKAWANLEAQQLSKVRKWSGEELKSINQTSNLLFYPFSGPDFLYAYSFFPNASDYVLVGLEPVGKVPDLAQLSDSQLKTKLREVNGSMDAILGFSFFRTKAMKVDLEKQGVLPILYVFMARTNNRILDIQYIGLNKDAIIQNLNQNKPDKTLVPGVKISFVQKGKSKPQTLYYFSTDLSNSGLQKTPGFNKFVKKFDAPVTYLKAASYLMYNDSFSSMRNLILSQSNSLLQDDSGIPIKYFDQKKWNLAFYGTYTKPIDLFSKQYQPDLRKIYSTDKKIEPLNFGIGYKYRVNQSNLMLAIESGNLKSKP